MSEFITCKILDLKDHPQASKLKVATVSDGKNNFTIVCGAKNIRVGMVSVLAKVGATTIHGLLIQESAIRGVTSEGMLCSPLELGISQEQGIVDLPPQTQLGITVSGLSKDSLSSTPWWSYQLVERFYTDAKNKNISIQRSPDFKALGTENVLSSETYWYEGKYHYRNY